MPPSLWPPVPSQPDTNLFSSRRSCASQLINKSGAAHLRREAPIPRTRSARGVGQASSPAGGSGFQPRGGVGWFEQALPRLQAGLKNHRQQVEFLTNMTTYPLGVPDELMEEVKRTAADAHLSMADAMCRAIKFGLPQVREGASRESDFAEAAAETWEKLGPAPTVLYDQL